MHHATATHLRGATRRDECELVRKDGSTVWTRYAGTPMFESFHLFQNRPGVSPSGRIVVSAQQGGRDAILVIDSESGRVLRDLDFPDLVAIHDPKGSYRIEKGEKF